MRYFKKVLFKTSHILLEKVSLELLDKKTNVNSEKLCTMSDSHQTFQIFINTSFHKFPLILEMPQKSSLYKYLS